ncbi:MAG TPA: hypothetical protein DCF45_10910 [Gammaproteobacteria bacterium]|nr:hypothetical protein [Gammaproteobacteria bacterium]
MPVTHVSDPNYEFKDIVERRKKELDGVARLGKRLLPLTWLLQGVFALARLVGLESLLFKPFFKPMVKMFDDAIEEGFKGYTPQDSDVFVCSYFKSGTNWVMNTAYQIAEQGEGEFEDALDVMCWADCPSQATTAHLDDDRQRRRSRNGKRIIKTHARAQFVPYSEKATYICVVRDPKEVVVSSYFFFGKMLLGNLIPSVATWVKHCTSPGAVFHPWYEFTAGYWAWRDRPNVLFITYRELQEDSAGAIRKMAELMGITLTEDELQKVADLSSYEQMKLIDDKFYPGEVSPFARPGGSMIRSGKQGNSSELLTAQQQAHIDEWNRTGLQAIGSDFPYDEKIG